MTEQYTNTETPAPIPAPRAEAQETTTDMIVPAGLIILASTALAAALLPAVAAVVLALSGRL